MWRWLLMAALILPSTSASRADEGAFLKTLGGNWAGTGTVRIRAHMSPMNISCNFSSKASDAALSMEGVCRGMLLISRSIDAKLRFTGSTYSGSYLGPAAAAPGSTAHDAAMRSTSPFDGRRKSMATAVPT